MNKKSAKRKRKNLITKLAMTSALTLGVGAAATMTGQTEVRAEAGGLRLSLDMRNNADVKKFVEDLKNELRRNHYDNNTRHRIFFILEGYQNIKEEIEKNLAIIEQTKEYYGKQLVLTDQLYQSEKAKKEKLEAELEENQQKIQELNAQVDGAAKEKQELQEQLSKEIETSKQRIQELETELKKLITEKADLQEKLAMQEQAHAEEKAKLQKEIDELNAQLEKLKHCQD
ncbi:TPA: cell surface-anchored protein, partial [Streptococcus equi subsp. zooepidemicus]|nr:cell surface-anchored protein [Streptococcus equi subsp. zooepidemicus]